MSRQAKNPKSIKLDKLKKNLESSPMIKMGDYDYFVNPITDGIPKMDPAVLSEVLQGILAIGDFDCQLIVAPESMGIPLAVPLSLKLGIPYNIVRKKRYGLPGEIRTTQVTGYSKSDMYINGVSPGEKVTVVDSVVSTGGTLRAVLEGLKSAGADVVEVLVAVEKGDGKSAIESEFNVRIKSLVKISCRSGRVEIID